MNIDCKMICLEIFKIILNFLNLLIVLFWVLLVERKLKSTFCVFEIFNPSFYWQYLFLMSLHKCLEFVQDLVLFIHLNFFWFGFRMLLNYSWNFLSSGFYVVLILNYFLKIYWTCTSFHDVFKWFYQVRFYEQLNMH